MLLIYQSSIKSQILDFIHWTVMIFSFDHMTGENREYKPANQHHQQVLLIKSALLLFCLVFNN